MKRKLAPHFLIAALAGMSPALAQEERPIEPPRTAEPPPPAEQRPPLPPQELGERPRRDAGPAPDDRPERPGPPPERRDENRFRDGGPRGPGDRRGPNMRRGGPDDEGRPERFREFRREAVERSRKPTPYIGVVSLPVPPPLSAQLGLEEGFGLVVENVLPESPAQAAGVQRYDVLKLLNDQQLMSPDQLSRLVARLGKDGDATLTIIRKGQEQKVPIKVGEKSLPARDEQPSMGMRGFGSGGGGIGGFDRPQIEEFRRRMRDMGDREGGESTRGMQERMRAMQEKMRGYQEAMRRYQEQLREWQKNPGTEQPQMPQFPELPAEPAAPERPGRPGQPGQPGIRPADILRELRPGDHPPMMRSEWSEGSSRWDGTRARIVMRDRDGELEIAMKDGKRQLTVKDPQGEVVFSGPVESPEQRAAIPERFRDKLDAMAPPPPMVRPPDGPGALLRSSERRPPLPQIEREPDVQ